MDRLVRTISMATARASTRRGFMSDLARGLITGGLGASFLFGGRRFAFADNCTTLSPGNCNGDCTQGIDGYGCYSYTSLCGSGCNAGGSGCNTDAGFCDVYSWTCCCGGRRTRCATCKHPSTGQYCECRGYTGGTC